MTQPTPPSMPQSSYLGSLIGDYPGSLKRFTYIPIGVASLYLGVAGTLANIEFGPAYRVFFVGFALICGWEFFANYGIHARVFEQGFTLSRGGAETSVRWEDITGVKHETKRGYILSLIPEPWVSHIYTISVLGGKPLTLSSSHLSNVERLGDSIQVLRSKAIAAAQAKAPGASA